MNIFLVIFVITTLFVLFNEIKYFDKFLGTFLLISVLLVIATGFYSWIEKSDDIDTLTYLPDQDWAVNNSIPQIHSLISDCDIDNEANLHAVWTEYNSQTTLMKLEHIVINSQGKIIEQPKILLENKQIQQIAVEIVQDQLHIFWIGKSGSQKMDLYYTRTDLAGQIQEQKTVLKNQFHNNVTELHLASLTEDFMLSWVAKEDLYSQVYTLLVNSDIQVKQKPINRSIMPVNSRNLNLVSDQLQQYHLIWQHELSNQVSLLYYQGFDREGQVLTAPRLLAQGQIGENTLTTSNRKLYLAWEQRIIDKTEFSLIYGTILHLDHPNIESQTYQLTDQDDFATNPSLAVDTTGQIYLSYTEKKYHKLAYQIFTDNLVPVMDTPRWIFPEEIFPTKTQLVADSKGQIHFYWLNTKGDRSLHYTNNIHSSKITPLEIIGLPRLNFIQRLWQNLLYIFTAPLLDLSIFIVFFTNAVSIMFITYILMNIHFYLKNEKQIRILEKNLSLVTFIICFIQIGVSALTLRVLKHPVLLQHLKEHLMFIIIASLVANFVYIGINKIKKSEPMFGGAVSLAWLYWVIIIIMTLNLPFMNY